MFWMSRRTVTATAAVASTSSAVLAMTLLTGSKVAAVVPVSAAEPVAPAHTGSRGHRNHNGGMSLVVLELRPSRPSVTPCACARSPALRGARSRVFGSDTYLRVCCRPGLLRARASADVVREEPWGTLQNHTTGYSRGRGVLYHMFQGCAVDRCVVAYQDHWHGQDARC